MKVKITRRKASEIIKEVDKRVKEIERKVSRIECQVEDLKTVIARNRRNIDDARCGVNILSKRIQLVERDTQK